MLAPALLLLGGCTDDFAQQGHEGRLFVTPTTAYLRLQASQLDFAPEGGEGNKKTIQVQSYGMPWRLTPGADWIKVSPESGTGTQDVTVTVLPNDDADASLSSSIVLDYDPESGKNLVVPGLLYRWTAPVSQARARGRLVVDFPQAAPGINQMLSAEAGRELRVPVDANCAWSVYSTPSWLSATPEQGALRLAVTEQNNALESRKGEVVLRYDYRAPGAQTRTVTVPVTQDILHISVPANCKLNFDRQGGTQTIEGIHLEGNTVVSAPSWLHLQTVTKGDGTTSIAVMADENATYASANNRDTRRSGYISISAKNAAGSKEHARIEVTQDPRIFMMEGYEGKTEDVTNGIVPYISMPVTGDTKPLKITTNSDFKIYRLGTTWLSVDGQETKEFKAPEHGLDSYMFDVTADYNESNGTKRRSWIYLWYPAVTDLLQVNQAGPSVTTDATGSNWAFNSHPSSFSLNVEASAKWIAELINPDGSAVSWAHVASGSPGIGGVPGGEQLTIAIDENTTGVSRTCLLRLNVAGYKGSKYEITQFGNTVISNGNTLTFDASGDDTHRIFLRTASEVTASCDADWVHWTCEEKSVAGQNQLKYYSYELNVEVEPWQRRNAVFRLSYNDNGQKYEEVFNIIALSSPINVTVTDSYEFSSNGGSRYVWITGSSSEISAYSDVDWLSLEFVNGNEVRVIAKEWNESGTQSRDGKIYFFYTQDSEHTYTESLTFRQWGPITVSTPEGSEFGYGGTLPLKVKGPAGMTLKSAVSLGTTWLQVSPTIGTIPSSGELEFQVTAPWQLEESDRVGGVQIYNSQLGVNKTINFSQTVTEPLQLNVSNTRLSFSEAGGEIPLTISSNHPEIISLEPQDSWIDLIPASATGSQSNVLQYTVKVPESENGRTGYILIKVNGIVYSRIVVEQNFVTSISLPTSFSTPNYQAYTLPFTIEASNPKKIGVSSSDSWAFIELDKLEGTVATYKVYIEENASNAPRGAVLRIFYNSILVHTCVVTQAGKP